MRFKNMQEKFKAYATKNKTGQNFYKKQFNVTAERGTNIRHSKGAVLIADNTKYLEILLLKPRNSFNNNLSYNEFLGFNKKSGGQQSYQKRISFLFQFMLKGGLQCVHENNANFVLSLINTTFYSEYNISYSDIYRL